MRIPLSLRYLIVWGSALTASYGYAVAPNTVIATINVGVNPNGSAITPDNKFLYVANNNNYAIAGNNAVSVLNAITNMPVTTIYESDLTATGPYTVTMNAAGTKAYVTNSGSSTVAVIDVATNTIGATIPGFDGPSGFAIVPGTNTAYVNNYGATPGLGSGNGHTLSIVDLTTNMIVGSPINVDLAPAALAVSPDGAYVYSVNYVDGNPGTGTMNVIRTSDNTLTTTIFGFSGPFDLTVTPDGKFAYVANFGSNNFEPFGTTVSVVDLTNYVITATITVGIQPSGIKITPDGKYVYVTNYNSLYTDPTFAQLLPGEGTINIIDVATNTLLPITIVVGQSPDTVTISNDGRFAYVSNYSSNTVSVIGLPSAQLVGSGCRTQNRFLNRTDYINRLTWSASGTSLPVTYSIYRDAELTDLVAMIPANATTMQYLDRNRNPNIIYTYYIVGTNSAGVDTEPLVITVTQNC